MKTKHNSRFKSVVSLLIVCMMIIGMVPTTFAAQDNEYVDPADSWLTANGRTNELDMNATTTYETQRCYECGKDTTVLTYRVPEYTRSGETAANRGVKYSDGANMDGDEFYNLDDGTPGVDARYTGYHWTKSVCNACGTLNPSDWNAYCYNRNVYGLNACDHNFFVDFDNTEYMQYNSTQHYVYLKEGEYCAFCKGTYAQAMLGREAHDFSQLVDAQLANNRFYVAETCVDCGFETSEYVVAKSVITSYYGEVDGEAHTVEVSDLSENDVTTRIRYGTEAGNCNRTSAPNFTTAGYHTVYYEIDYIYAGETMTENGVGYVWLLEENNDSNGTIIVVPPQAHEHDYHYLETVLPSCDTLGYDRFQCNGCGDLIKTNYVQALGHNYSDVLIREATCKQNGVKLHMCKSCGDFYEESTPLAGHDYDKHTHDATCKSVGYDEYTCTLCGDNYINNIKPMVEHRYRQLVRHPDCEEEGYTNNICEMCNASYVSDYVDALGHAWDEGRTVTASGCDSEGVIEYTCTNGCGEKMIIASDATGHTPGAEATCTEPQICEVCETVLELPKGHSYTDTVVDPTCTESGYTKHECDECDHSYIDSYIDIIPHDYDAVVSDENGVIPNAYVVYNEDGSVSVDLPEGNGISHHNRVTVTVLDSIAKPIEGVTVTVKDVNEVQYTGTSDSEGKVFVPPLSEDYTDAEGKAVVNGINVLLTDETKPIEGAFITVVENQINVKLPESAIFDYHNRITAALTDAEGNPVKDITVIFTDGNGNTETVVSDENGKAIVPPVHRDMTDVEGKAVVSGYNVVIADEQAPIANAYIEIVDGKISVVLPENSVLDLANRISVTVTDSEDKPVKDMSVTVKDKTERTETNLTNEAGIAIVPPTNIDETDVNGYGELNEYSVTVKNETAPVEKAYIEINENGEISVKLPEGILIAYDNRITVTVANKADKTPIKDVKVTVTETIAEPEEVEGEEEGTETAEPEAVVEPKSISGVTDRNGIAVFPALSEDITDNEGGSSVTDTKEEEGKDNDGDGQIDEPGEVTETKYIVTVNDTKGIITDAFVTVKDGKITVKLPETHTLTTANQTTVTVKDADGKPKANVSVTINDKTTSKSGTTNANGIVTLPVKTSGGGGGGGSYSGGGGGGGSYLSTTVNVKVVDKDGKTVSVSKSTATDKVTLTLPTGKDLVKDNNYYTITVTDRSGKAKADYTVVLKDKNKNEVTAKTDDKGIVVLPAVEHTAYVKGYTDGTFRPEGDMTRSEAAAIFARLVADKKGETISGKASFKDIPANAWYNTYVGYLEKYDVINGYTDGTFKPEAPVTRAEFTAMAVRYFDIFEEVKYEDITSKYMDVNGKYWAIKDISYASNKKWLNGYVDGTFKPDINITRAEVVTVVNRVTGRTADQDYINKNLEVLDRFTDLKTNSHWAFYDIIEAANDHMATTLSNSENWID